MAAIHKLSSSIPLSEFDIFAVPPTQSTIESDILSEHRPTSALDSKSYIEFSLTSGLDEYIRLDKTWLYLKIQVSIEKPVKIDVTREDWKLVSTVNNLFSSLFKQVDLYIGDRCVTSSNQTYHYKTDLEIKLGKTKDAKESHMTSCLWYTDDIENLEAINQLRSEFISPQIGTNEVVRGKQVDLMGKIHIPMLEQNKALLGGCSLKFRFLPNDPSFYMMCANTVRVTSVDFLNASLYIHRSKIARPILEGHLKALEIANAKYQIRESFVVPITINRGTIDKIIDNVHNGQLPRRAFVTFVNHNSFNGSFSLNPFNYQHYNLNYLAFYLNGIQYPEKAFTPDFTNNLYVREYLSLFEATNQEEGDSCINITRDSFRKGNSIFAVNFAPDHSSGCCATGYANPIKYGSLRLQVRFKEALPEAITVLVYLEYDSLLEINKERNPIYELV